MWGSGWVPKCGTLTSTGVRVPGAGRLTIGNDPSIWTDRSAARNHAGREGLHVRTDLARAREPDAVAMREDVLERATQAAQPIRAPDHERVQGDRTHERLAGRPREPLVEMMADTLA